MRDSDRKILASVIECGVKQTLGYMKQCVAEEGHLVVMDRRSEERRRGEGAEADYRSRVRAALQTHLRGGWRNEWRGVVRIEPSRPWTDGTKDIVMGRDSSATGGGTSR